VPSAEAVAAELALLVVVERLADVISAVVGIDQQAGRGVKLECSESREAFEGDEVAPGANRDIGNRGGAVAAHAIAVESLETDIELMSDGHAQAAADAGTPLDIVEGRRPGAVDAIAEGAGDAEDFIVAVAWIKGGLEDEIRSWVDGVGGQVAWDASDADRRR